MMVLAPLLLLSWLAPGEWETYLERAVKQAEKQIQELGALACTEKVSQLKLDEKNKTLAQRQTRFDYLILLNTDGGDLSVEESRLEQDPGRKPRAPEAPLVSTTGFAALLLVLHPAFASGFQFTDLGPVREGGLEMRLVRFQHITGRPTPSVLQVKDREYPVSWKGMLWLDAASAQARRIQVELRDSMLDIGLHSLAADVRYGAAHAGGSRQDWVPLSAVVDLHTRRQHWRNTHEFSAFRRFEVTTQERREAIEER